MPDWLTWLLGIDSRTDVESIGGPRLVADWAEGQLFWICVGVLTCFLVSFWYYFRNRRLERRPLLRAVLGSLRGLALAILFLTLAVPVLPIIQRESERPTLFVLFDGTESMKIEDRWSLADRQSLAAAIGVEPQNLPASRQRLVQQWLKRPDNVVAELSRRRDLDVQAFVFDGKLTSRLRSLANQSDTDQMIQDWADKVTSSGQVTALGSALRDLNERALNKRAAGVLIVSDFANNAGISPVRRDRTSPAEQLRTPVFTIGVGATRAVDVSVGLQTDPKMKLAEESHLIVRLRHSSLRGRVVDLVVQHHPGSGKSGPPIVVRRQQVTLGEPEVQIRIPFVPQVAGHADFTARVEPLDEEIATENNTATRSVRILDDYLRLMYISHEPTWEWHFIKEVFHRDSLVGLRGFRTFLSSSDPGVRESNALFLPTMTPARSEFFENDVIFLEDMPAEALTPRFCEMVEQFVGELGGGLVVLVGPHFGTRPLIGTRLEKLLPVILDGGAALRDEREFPLQRTEYARFFDFMRLGADESEGKVAWAVLNKLPWYHPVRALVADQATVLAEHPSDMLSDNRTRQPLIAHRQYGRGQVVFFSFNETWRLRKRYGERYYRQFWSQLIYRLGMSHALGHDKRFVPVLGQRNFQVEDRLRYRVEAYDKNYQPMRAEDVAGGTLKAEMQLPGRTGRPVRELSIPFVRRGVFETDVQLFEPGEYRIRVRDPVRDEWVERQFFVAERSAERRDVVRDVKLQNELSAATGGRAYDLTNADQLVSQIDTAPTVNHTATQHALWNTPLWFILIISLVLGEWFLRKQAHLT